MSENMLFRKLLWLRHGCPPRALYGDDGEMQCSVCMIDFLRDSPERIEQRFIEINKPRLAEFLKTVKPKKNKVREYFDSEEGYDPHH